VQKSQHHLNGSAGANITTMTQNSQGRIFAGTFGGGVFVSDDDGDTWRVTSGPVPNAFVTALAVDLTGTLFAGTLEGVSRSVDAGNTWETINAGIESRSINDFSFAEDNTAFVATNGSGVCRLAPGATSWIQANTGLDNSMVLSLAVGPDNELIAGTDGDGIFQSVDQGDTWFSINDGLDNDTILSLFTSSAGMLFAGSNGSGVFRNVRLTTTVQSPATSIPNRFGLSQNYPNPFNPETQITFELPSSTKVTLAVYNLLGQEILVLVDEEMSSGTKSVRWDGKDRVGRAVASGVYVYKLLAGQFSETRRMTLLR